MLTAASILLSVVATSSATGFKSGKLCFYRDHWIFIKDLATGKEKKLVEGVTPRLSPDGNSIVYLSMTEHEQNSVEAPLFPFAGRLRVLTLWTMKTQSFESLRESHISNPVWSSDGKLAFALSDNHKRSIAKLNPVTGIVEKSITADWDAVIGPKEAIYIDSWTPGGRAVLFHTLSALYEADFETGNVRKIAAEVVFDKIIISSATSFVFSPDCKYLLVDGMISTRDEPEGQLISLYDLTSKSLRRLTPKRINARAPVWVGDQLLLTRADYAKQRWVMSISKIGLDGRGLTTIARNADDASYAPK